MYALQGRITPVYLGHESQRFVRASLQAEGDDTFCPPPYRRGRGLHHRQNLELSQGRFLQYIDVARIQKVRHRLLCGPEYL